MSGADSLGKGPSRGRSILYCAAAYILACAAALLVSSRFPAAGPLLRAAAGDLIATAVVFIFSVVLNNSSIYDPYWSVAPIPIVVYWSVIGAGTGAFPSLRGVVVLVLLAAWACRLTWNWLRRWRGLQHEDWRYSDYRRLGPAGYWVVSFTGFHFFPTVLVFLACLSLLPVLIEPAHGFRLLDVAALLVTAAAIAIEAGADRQLRAFVAGKRPREEVLQSGLWGWSRHPNYFGEVTFWWGLFLFGLSANPRWWWTIAGPAAITLLFSLVSVPMMERHMAGRHAGYAEQQRGRSPLIPWYRRYDA